MQLWPVQEKLYFPQQSGTLELEPRGLARRVRVAGGRSALLCRLEGDEFRMACAVSAGCNLPDEPQSAMTAGLGESYSWSRFKLDPRDVNSR